MNIVLIDTSLAGASGDKMVSAFASASGKSEDLKVSINSALKAIGRPDVEISFEHATSGEIGGLQLKVRDAEGAKDEGGIEARTAEDSLKTLGAAAESIGLRPAGKAMARRTMDLLIEAERAVHGTDVLHELGSIDTIIDIIGTFKAIELLGVGDCVFYTTPVAVGCGAATSSHGTFPVPAPATLSIIRRAGLPVTRTDVPHELTTPTGAALLATLTCGRTDTPPFRLSRGTVGNGIGRRELGFPNITRVITGEAILGTADEEIFIVETNVDDVDGEGLGWLFERLNGVAEDVCVVPMLTKKNRPGHIVMAVATSASVGRVIDAILDETGTLGVKVSTCRRLKVNRDERAVEVKISGKSYSVGVKTNLRTGCYKPSYEDCRRIALEEGIPLKRVVDLVRRQLPPKA
ncbi:MAG: nickel pincer cofactor biosynthesis protein LarC [Candidatus Methanosuratus sp.]|nr:nickel pincer cofactor biosynthesis protein LarC [Candidatus Methanosuratincola sp.]